MEGIYCSSSMKPFPVSVCQDFSGKQFQTYHWRIVNPWMSQDHILGCPRTEVRIKGWDQWVITYNPPNKNPIYKYLVGEISHLLSIDTKFLGHPSITRYPTRVSVEVIVTIYLISWFMNVYNLFMGLTTYFYRGYNPVTEYHGHPRNISHL